MLPHKSVLSTVYYKEWDTIIDQWINAPQSILPYTQGKSRLSIEYLPEPYYGDMDNCSIVIINLNPGTGICTQHQSLINIPKTEIYEANNKKYSGYAKPFMYLDDPYPLFCRNSEAAKWWKPRKRWIDRILINRGINTDKKPFAIELCSLHSPSFELSNPAKYISIIRKINSKIDVMPAIEYAITKSDAKLGLAVGKPIYNAMIKNGYSDVLSIPNRMQGLPREYRVVEKNGIKILCTWTPGSNNAPSKIYDSFEKQILSVIP